MAYWRTLPYLGVGVAAHSFIEGYRFANTRDLDEYLETSSSRLSSVRDLEEEIGPTLQVAEAIIMGLRLTEGISFDEIRHRFGTDLRVCYADQIDELVGLGLLEADDRCLRLTRRGRLLGNEAFWRFLPEECS
jgi:oxygen-independent coproporphyrinogen-3 oxidase